MKRKGKLSPILILVFLVVAPLSAPLRTNYAALNQEPADKLPVLTCPTGSLVAFTKPAEPSVAAAAEKTRVYLRREDSFDQQVWETTAQPVDLPSVSSEQKSEVGIGFVVPPLDRRRYLAWYGATDQTKATDSLTFDAVPQLFVEQGITRGTPDTEVSVQVRIAATERMRLGSPKPESVSVPITLESPDATLAEVLGNPTVPTDETGVARWRVRIKKLGIGALTAKAEQFEPTVMAVVGMPGPGDAFWQAQLTALEQHARALERSTEQELVAAEVNKRMEVDPPEPAGVNPPPRLPVRPPEIARVNPRVPGKPPESVAMDPRARPQRLPPATVTEEFKRAEIQRRQEVATARAAAVQWAKDSEREPPRLAEWQLEPGDVLLVLGSSYFSNSIREFEKRQLGVQAGYSHASLYLGEINGVKMVGEMWGKGFWITPLSVSVAGTIVVDVYRHSQADRTKRTQLAEQAAKAFGETKFFIRKDSPSFWSRGSLLAYAFEQIGLLGLASSDALASAIDVSLRTFVDPRAGGRRKMICSEYVAWAYHDVGLELQVPAWKTLSDLNLLNTHERLHDYTTPNMLALSQSLGRVGRYRGP